MAPPDWAWSAARACGVTRLADVTRLDRLGVPVFQAVRPWSRALSVHQGKSFSEEDARIGALMEAVESDHAETYAGETRHATFCALEPAERVSALADFAAADGAEPDPDEVIAWTPAALLDGGNRVWAPFDVISLDFTRRGNERLDRSSNGLGAERSREAAIINALLEVIERDAVWAWRRSSQADRTLSRLAADTIPFGWFGGLRERILAAGLRMAVYRAPAVIDLPVMICEISEGGGGAPRRRWLGFACRGAPETALARCVAEAAQARLTQIAGVRDDLPPGLWSDDAGGATDAGLPLPSHFKGASWRAIEASFPRQANPDVASICTALNHAGYPQAAIVDLSRPGAAVFVVKALVPGLAAFARGRRQGGAPK